MSKPGDFRSTKDLIFGSSPQSPLTPEQKQAVEALSHGIVNKILHAPITTLKTTAGQPEATTVIEVIRRLFNLGDDKKAGS